MRTVGKKIVQVVVIMMISLVMINCETGIRKEKRVLVYTKNGEGYVHDNIQSNVKAIQELGEENGFLVDVSDAPELFTKANLEKYSCLIFANTNNDVFDTDEQKVAFMRYIQAGGGFVGIHSACGTERNWEWFIRLLGGTFVVHAVFQEFTVNIIDHNHPSTRNLPDRWTRVDECYFLTKLNPAIHVLITHDLSTIDDPRKETFPDIFGDEFPGAWYHEFEGGRSWYTSYGHRAEDYDDPLLRDHILGGILYAIGKNRELDYSKATATTPY